MPPLCPVALNGMARRLFRAKTLVLVADPVLSSRFGFGHLCSSFGYSSFGYEVSVFSVFVGFMGFSVVSFHGFCR